MGKPAEKRPTLLLGIRHSERNENAAPGLVWRKAKEGETLGTIADDYGVRPIDLALYNWNTADPLEINWYLNHFVGCTQPKGGSYSFTGQEVLAAKDGKSEPGGYLLVPNIPLEVKKGPRRSVAAVRNGRAKHDLQLHVQVVEWLANGRYDKVSGKWLYVFSGGGGVDFRYEAPPESKPSQSDQDDGAVAFQRQFPGIFPISAKPDKVEYEIVITAENDASGSMMAGSPGLRDEGEPYYKPGANWYFLSGGLLDQALNESRDRRTTHAFRNTEAVSIDLRNSKRYYFLLSPVQLGPEALKLAMASPKGLTPLLKPDDNLMWDPTDPNIWPGRYKGPTFEDLDSGLITLGVIDPYHWAENIAGRLFHDAIQRYVEWLGISQAKSVKSQTVQELTGKTGWTLDHLYIAKLLKVVRDHHPDPESIDKRLKDPDQWKSNLDLWDKELTQQNAAIIANAYRALIQLCDWLNGPAHAIVETAILKDANANSYQDGIDVAHGVLHWCICAENMLVLEPGVAFLQDLFSRPGSVPTDIVLKHLDIDKGTANITETNQLGLRIALPGTFGLLAVHNFLAPTPTIVFNGDRKVYLSKLADYQAARRTKLIKLINALRITPAPLVPVELDPIQAPSGGMLVAGAAVNSWLDAADKLTNYVLTKKYKRAGLASLEEWFEKNKGSKVKSLSLSYTLKGFALIFNGLNLYVTVTTARYDYQTNQNTVSPLGKAQTWAGVTVAVQDVLAELGSLLKSQRLQKLFPQLVTTGGKTYHYEIANFEGFLGVSFAVINVAAMLIAGVTTSISMWQNANDAVNRGDYTAAKLYMVGLAGGGAMTLGAGFLAYAVVFSATGAGATVGIILFAIGGIISALASLIAWCKSSDEFQIFARKCFLGEQGTDEPRFGSNPQPWSHALKTRTNTWPLELQKRAMHDLLGRFTVKTSVAHTAAVGDTSTTLNYEIKPLLFRPWCSLEVLLEYEKDGGPATSATFYFDPTDEISKVVRPRRGSTAGIFDPMKSSITFFHTGDVVNLIQIEVGELNYDQKFGKLLTTVTLCFPDLPNKIRTRKLVMEGYDEIDVPVGVDVPIPVTEHPVLHVDDGTEQSEIFD